MLRDDILPYILFGFKLHAFKKEFKTVLYCKQKSSKMDVILLKQFTDVQNITLHACMHSTEKGLQTFRRKFKTTYPVSKHTFKCIIFQTIVYLYFPFSTSCRSCILWKWWQTVVSCLQWNKASESAPSTQMVDKWKCSF